MDDTAATAAETQPSPSEEEKPAAEPRRSSRVAPAPRSAPKAASSLRTPAGLLFGISAEHPIVSQVTHAADTVAYLHTVCRADHVPAEEWGDSPRERELAEQNASLRQQLVAVTAQRKLLVDGIQAARTAAGETIASETPFSFQQAKEALQTQFRDAKRLRKVVAVVSGLTDDDGFEWDDAMKRVGNLKTELRAAKRIVKRYRNGEVRQKLSLVKEQLESLRKALRKSMLMLHPDKIGSLDGPTLSGRVTDVVSQLTPLLSAAVFPMPAAGAEPEPMAAG